ncbi:major facilitator superfamily domain-containing protein [Sporodiniella umbellata]|nr:major facilitator superfamily domain-containing protein [Sporodiniella umbellata]
MNPCNHSSETIYSPKRSSLLADLSLVNTKTRVEEDIEKKKAEEVNTKIDTETLNEEEKCPWHLVFGSFLVLTVGLGAGQSWGVFQNYYEQINFGNDHENLPLKLSFAQTIYNVLINILGPMSQIILIVLGPKKTLFVSVVISSLGLLLASFSTQIWHLYLTHGIVYGTGISIMYYVSVSTIPQYFTKYRGLALGITSSGISIGGLAFPYLMEPINSMFGASWCYRVLSLICLVIGLLSCCFMNVKKITETKMGVKDFSFRKTFDFSVAKNWRYLLWCVINILLVAACNTPAYFIPSYATYIGLTSYQGAIVLSITSGSNAMGSFAAGLLGDYIGHINITMIYCIMSSVSCLAIWKYAYNFGSLLAFCIMYGFFCSGFLTLSMLSKEIQTSQANFCLVSTVNNSIVDWTREI